MGMDGNHLAGAALLALLAAAPAGAASAQANVEEGRPRDAVEMCRERAEEIVRDRSEGRDVEVVEITEADEEDDRVKVEGYLRVEDRDGDHLGNARLDCEVDFDGDDRIAAFDDDLLIESLERDDGDVARAACHRIAEEREWRDIRTSVRDERRDRDERRVVVAVRGVREGDERERRCIYDARSGRARFEEQG